MNIPVPTKKGANAKQIGALSHDTIKQLKEWQAEPEKHRPIKTNIAKLDKAFGGIVEGSYVVIGGKDKSGKTTFAQHIATILGISNRGTVKYFLLEEMKKQMAIRAMTRQTPKITRTQIRNLELTDNDFNELEIAANMLENVNLLVDDELNTCKEIIASLTPDIKWIVVDYFQLLGDRLGKNENERLEGISRLILEDRNKTGRTWIVVYQIGIKTGRAHGSNTLYRDADVILQIRTGKEENTEEDVPGSMFIDVLPGRSCPGGTHVEIGFSGAHSRIMDMPKFDAENLTPIQETIFNPQDFIQEEMEINDTETEIDTI